MIVFRDGLLALLPGARSLSLPVDVVVVEPGVLIPAFLPARLDGVDFAPSLVFVFVFVFVFGNTSVTTAICPPALTPRGCSVIYLALNFSAGFDDVVVDVVEVTESMFSA